MGIIRSHEPAENAAMLMSRNTDAIVAHTEQSSLCLLIFTECDFNIPALGAVLDCIADEVAHYLLNASRIDSDNNVFWRGFYNDSVTFCCHVESLYCTLNERNQVRR